MRVVLVAPLVAALRASAPGGAEAVVADLAVGLRDAGHQVDVVAARGSAVPGVRVHGVPGTPLPATALRFHRSATSPSSPGWDSRAAGAHLAALAIATGLQPDVVHLHAHDWPPAWAAPLLGPAVHTLHLPPVDRATVQALAMAAAAPGRPLLTAVSRSCAASWRGTVRVHAIVPNGCDPAIVPLGLDPDPGLAVVPGRISPEKGTHLAIAAARRAGLRVIVAGPVYDRDYLREQVTPLLREDGVRWVGAVSRRRLLTLLGRAAVVVLAPRWEEPFGMVALEANLAGTPVAAFARGGLPEVLGRRGGVLVEAGGIPALAWAARRCLSLDRAAVRRSAARRLPLSRMVAGYERAYGRAVAQGGRGR